ncbi:MAG: NAD(P)H-hydrate dehydratase [Candidatus Diapherotrites archaeon]|nr:NAD(P)H-hydrate dehydratase [Candidatus Diapherotrites archaeon]
MPLNQELQRADIIKKSKIIEENALYYGFERLQIAEAAGKAIAEQFKKDFGFNRSIAICCGIGRKGTFGLSAARHLASNNRVSIHIFGHIERCQRPDYIHNLKIIANSFLPAKYYTDSSDVPKEIPGEIIIECLDEEDRDSLQIINSALKAIKSSKARKLSIDFPCNSLRPERTYSLLFRKSEDSVVIDIGIPKEFLFFTGPANVKYLSQRQMTSKKGDNGIILIIAGSKKYHGAAVYSGLAASMFSDLVFLLSEKENIPIMKKTSPELIVGEINKKNIKDFCKRADVVLVGPGLSDSKKNRKLLNFLFVNQISKKFVVDAGGFNVVKKKHLSRNFLLTPHRGEFNRFFGCEATPRNALITAKQHKCNILLKGPVDYISDGNAIYCNFTGNALMTAGGTGDVLAGVCAAFAAKNHLLDSALAASFLVGLAGDLIANKGSGLNATKLIEKLPEAKKICEKWK